MNPIDTMCPLVSVVMPVHNGERYLRESIDSILNQTWRDLELIIIDDDSIDTTPQILSDYRDERIVVRRNPAKLGPAPSRNHGISLARGKYIACMDADDVALPERLELQVDFLRRNVDIALVGGAAITIDSKGNPIDIHQPPVDAEELSDMLLESNCFVQSTVMMTSEAVRNVGGYRFPLAEDYDLWLRMSEHYKLANLSQTVLLYRTHSSQTSLQQILELAMWSIAARSSARARRNSPRDPMSGIENLTPNVLYKLGASETEIQNVLADSVLISLNLLLKMDEHTELNVTRETYNLLRCESITKNSRKDIAMRILALAHGFYSRERYRASVALIMLCVRLDARLLANKRTIRLAIKLGLGERGTNLIRGLKRIVGRTHQRSTA